VRDVAPVASIGGVSIASLNGESNAAVKQNNTSMVLRFSFGNWSLLFTGDLESAGERAILANGRLLRSTILKVPHHGSATSSTPAFVAAVNPAAAVISDGYLNNFRFPADPVVQRYVDEGAIVMRTDLDGAVMVDATKTRMTVRTFRGDRAAAIQLDSR
ncbi:MAG TPA: hypothetical protein VGR40_05560, partial [Candidatus Binatus sp.]|nr:hypothetical protein [Candidatus Binatus sp.]